MLPPLQQKADSGKAIVMPLPTSTTGLDSTVKSQTINKHICWSLTIGCGCGSVAVYLFLYIISSLSGLIPVLTMESYELVNNLKNIAAMFHS